MTRRVSMSAVIAVLVILTAGAAVTIALSVRGASTDAAHELAEGLSCPSCAGQSVAESDSPVAAGMRQTIAQQLAQGRSPAQIRDWFSARYGPEVVRSGASGTPTLMWAIPVVSVAALIVGMVAARRRRGGSAERHVGASVAHPWLTVGVLGAVVAIIVIGVAAGSAALDDPNDAVRSTAAADARSLPASSDDASIRLGRAFALLRAGQPVAARDVAQQARRQDPGSTDALLILGLAQRASGDPAWVSSLARFLAEAPEHPAASEIARLLESSHR